MGLLSDDTKRELQLGGERSLASKEAQLNWLSTTESLISLAAESYKAGSPAILKPTFDLFKVAIHFFNTMVVKTPEDAELFPESVANIKQASDLVTAAEPRCPLVRLF